MDHMTAMVQHLLWMHSFPGARDYAQQRVRDLVASHPMYETLPDLIRQARLSASAERQQESTVSTTEPARTRPTALQGSRGG